MNDVARLQGRTEAPEKKKVEDKGYFLQLPCVLLEAYSAKLNATAHSTLMRFLSEYLTWERDKAEYSGSYRALSRRFGISCSTLIKIVGQWVDAGFAQIVDTAERLTITVSLSPIWQQNVVYSKENKKQSRPKNGQTVELSKKETVELSKFETLQRLLNCSDVQKIDTAVQILDALVQKMDSLERDGEGIKNLEELTKNLIEYVRKCDEKIDEEKEDESAIAPPARTLTLLSLELDEDSEDLPEAQPKISYSHKIPQTPSLEQNTENTGTGADAGYKTNTDVNTPPQEEKSAKRNSRSKKEKVEQPTLLDTRSKAVEYNDAEQRVFEWFCNQTFNHVRPEQDKLKKDHSAKLVPHVHSQEDMDDLATFTKDRLNKQLKQMGKETVYTIKMGNLTNTDNLNAWLAQRKQKPAQLENTSSNVVSLDEERQKREREEEKNQRNLEANRQASIASMQEKLARGAKLLNFEVVMAVESYGLTLPPQYMAQYNASKQVAVSQ